MTQYQYSESLPLIPLFLCTIPEMSEMRAKLEESGRQVLDITSGTGWGLSFNKTAGDDQWQNAVKDQRFRQALSMALDRQQLVDMFGGTMEISSLAPTYDLDAAKALLAESGHKPTIVLQPWVQWLMPGSYQDELFIWLAESWTALGLDVQLNGVGQEWDSKTDTTTYVSLCLSPDPTTPLPLPGVILPEGESLAETQYMLPLVEGIQTPAHIADGLKGVGGASLPEVWQGVEMWYWE